MPGPIAFGAPDDASPPDHRRLLHCMALSAGALAIAITTVNVSLELDFSRLLPLVLEVTLREEAPPEAAPLTPPAAMTPPAAPVQETTTVPPAAVPAAPDEPAIPTTGAPTGRSAEAPVDWYAALERAAARTVEHSAEDESLHPEFDELRRIAALRYGPPQTSRPAAPQTVEKDIYGRTLLRRGNCFQVLEDTSAVNREVMETFGSPLQCAFGFGGKRGRNLPWVEPIRAKYNHLRDPDGSRSVPERGGGAAPAPRP